MTDAELRDAAVAELKLTTAGWRKPNGQPNYPSGTAPANTHWGKAMNLLGQIGAQPPPPAVTLAGGVHFHAEWNITNARRDAVLDKIAAGNFEWVRVGVEWEYIETSKGVYSSEQAKMDYTVSAAHARGLKVLGILVRTPKWANGGQAASVPPTNPADFGNFAKYAATRWSFDALQIWNEPDPSQSFFTGTVPQYAGLVKAAYPAIKAARNIPVVLGGPSLNRDAWIAEVYGQGTKDYFDVVATQPYQAPSDKPPSTPDSPPAFWNYMHFPAVLAVMNQYGDGAKPVWFTEFGYSTHANTGGEDNGNKGVTLQQQSDYLIEAFEIAKTWPNVKVLFVYKADNEGAASGNTNASIQLANYGLLNLDLTPKPAYTNLQAYLA